VAGIADQNANARVGGDFSRISCSAGQLFACGANMI
jgi:hypothetical protein